MTETEAAAIKASDKCVCGARKRWRAEFQAQALPPALCEDCMGTLKPVIQWDLWGPASHPKFAPAYDKALAELRRRGRLIVVGGKEVGIVEAVGDLNDE